MEEITIEEEINENQNKTIICNDLKNEFDIICLEIEELNSSFNILMSKLSSYKNKINNIVSREELNNNFTSSKEEINIEINDKEIKDKVINDKEINKKEEKERKAKEKQEEKERKARERQEKKEKREKELNEKKEKKEFKEKTIISLSQPNILPNKICDFIGVPHNTEMMRVDLTKEIHKYIRNNNLQDYENKKNIKPNKALLELLEIEEGVELTYFNIQSYLNKLF